MKKYDWENAFPKPTKKFHEKLVTTLDGLEREKKMKKISVKKGVIIAVAIAVLAIGSAAIATPGTIRTISGSSTSFPNYREIPTSEKLQKDIGITPKIVEEFSNEYKFDSAVKVNNSIDDVIDGNTIAAVVDENGREQKYKSLSVNYKNGDNEISIHADPADYDIDTDRTETENYNGVSLSYSAYTNKFVPGDYVQTEQDIKDEEEGKYVFSYGTDDIEIHEVQGVTWVQDGIKYHINAMDSPLGEQELIDMAKEVIDFE